VDLYLGFLCPTNNGQNPETQLVALRDYVQNRGWELTTEYVDHGPQHWADSDQRPKRPWYVRSSSSRRFAASSRTANRSTARSTDRPRCRL